MPYVALQQMLDEANAWGFHGYDKGHYVDDLTDGVIEVLTEHLPRKSSPLSVVLLYRLDQAYSEVAEDATAFGGGRSRGTCCSSSRSPPPRNFWSPIASGSGNSGRRCAHTASATVLTSNAIAESDEHRIHESYGPAKYQRLAQIKAKYYPGNIFHRNANIKLLPATG